MNKESDTTASVAVPVPPPKEKTLTSAQTDPLYPRILNSDGTTDPPPAKKLTLDSPIVSAVYLAVAGIVTVRNVWHDKQCYNSKLFYSMHGKVDLHRKFANS